MRAARPLLALLFGSLLFAGLPAWAYEESGVDVVCKPGGTCPAPRDVEHRASLLTLGDGFVPLRASLLTVAGALASLAAGWGLALVAERAWAARALLRPTPPKLLVAALGWATLPLALAQFLVFTRRLEAIGSAKFTVMSGAKVLAFLVFPLCVAQNALQVALLSLASLYAALAHADWLRPVASGLHPAYWTVGGAALVLVGSALVWYLVGCALGPPLARAVSRWRRPRDAPSTEP